MWYALGKQEIHTKYLIEIIAERNYSDDLETVCKIILKWVFRKYVAKMCTGLKAFRLGYSGGLQ
jgi:hypothetical protein